MSALLLLHLRMAWHVVSAVVQMLMSKADCQLAAAYGATGAFTNTGGSVSLAIYVAVSVRVGNCLGENKPANAKHVAWLGFQLAAFCGAVISCLIYLFREWLAVKFSPGGEGSIVYQETVEAVPIVAIYYWLNSLCWGAWGILQGQMRNALSTASLLFGVWMISVPLSVVCVNHDWLGTDLGSKLQGVWWASCAGEASIVVVMVAAIYMSNWEALAAVSHCVLRTSYIYIYMMM